MQRTVKSFMALGGLAAGLLFLPSAPAEASLAISYKLDGGALTNLVTCADFSSGCNFSGTVGGVISLNTLGASADNGNGNLSNTLSDLLSSTTTVRNLTTASHTIELWVSENAYTLPVGTPLNVEAGMAGTINTPTLALTNVFQAWANNSTTLFDTSGFTTGNQSGVLASTTFDTGSATGSFARTTATSTFTLTSVARLVLGAGASVNYSDHENLSSVPEPTSMLLLGTGLFGIAARARRRARKA